MIRRTSQISVLRTFTIGGDKSLLDVPLQSNFQLLSSGVGSVEAAQRMTGLLRVSHVVPGDFSVSSACIFAETGPENTDRKSRRGTNRWTTNGIMGGQRLLAVVQI